MECKTATPAEVRRDAQTWEGREVIAVFRAKPSAGAERGSPVAPDRHQLEGILRIGPDFFLVGTERLTDADDVIEELQLVG
ncbi:MAG TPA: hypothetical protein VFG23_04755 [Polyangia bacterium]|nr:hypothetical protein [Polyangia bacterium]